MTDPLRVLLDAGAEGDERALSLFVQRTQRVVWKICLNLGSDGHTEDLVQETYLRAIRAMPSFRGEAPVLSWLSTIARRTCADHVRQQTRRRRIDVRLRSMPIDAVAAAPHYTEDLLERLHAARREAFVLTQLTGLSYAEAADVLGCPVGTIRSRVARARADLAAMVNNDAAAG